MTDSEKADSEKDKKGRAQASFSYPYFNLESSIDVAKAIQEQGGGICTSQQLAAFLDYKNVRSGTFVTRVSSARLFGLIKGKSDALSITERAMKIIYPVMPEDVAQAKVAAFLNVPLYSELFSRFKGVNLPLEAGLKNLFENTYTISKDRVNPALRVFKESARQAGFFNLSKDESQLIEPVIKKGGNYNNSTGGDESIESNESACEVEGEKKPLPKASSGVTTTEVPSGIDPALTGLLRKLPPSGPWNETEKNRFFDAFKATFDFIYPSESTE